MGVAVGFSLHQFSEVLKIRDAAGQPYLLIGGQAVNYWAERYLAIEPSLIHYSLHSEDIDFKGGSDDVQRIARQLELTPGEFLQRVEQVNSRQALAGRGQPSAKADNQSPRPENRQQASDQVE